VQTPTDVANLALDAIGIDIVLGDIEDGTKEAQTCLRAYPECRKRLLRGAHWQFARKQVPMLMLADASGLTPQIGNKVIHPWRYEYAYPNDCVALRYIPHKHHDGTPPPGNYALPTSVPLYTNMTSIPMHGRRPHPARFLVARDVNYPPQPGQDFWDVQGLSPQGRTVICTDVKNAEAVYTSDVVYPNEWDSLFTEAMVAYLAQHIVMKLSDDKKLGMQMRTEQIAIAKDRIINARVADGNETWSTNDLKVDWMEVRREGFGGYGLGGGLGEGSWCGWSSVSFSDGQAF
jgi:hypothetical protein